MASAKPQSRGHSPSFDNGNLASLEIALLAGVPTARIIMDPREQENAGRAIAEIVQQKTSDVRYVKISSRNGTQNTTAIQIMVKAMPSATKLIGHCATKLRNLLLSAID